MYLLSHHIQLIDILFKPTLNVDSSCPPPRPGVDNCRILINDDDDDVDKDNDDIDKDADNDDNGEDDNIGNGDDDNDDRC